MQHIYTILRYINSKSSVRSVYEESKYVDRSRVMRMSLTVSCNLSTVPDLSVLKRLREVSVSRAVDAHRRPHISVHIDMFEQLQYLEKLSLYRCDLVTDKSKIQLPSRLEILYIQYCGSSDQSVNDNMIVDNLPISVEKLTPNL